MPNQHTPQFIAEMKNLLLTEQKRLQHDLQAIAPKTGADYKVNFPDYGRNDEDNATEIGDYTTATAAKNVLAVRLNNVNSALERIRLGTYGITTAGELISTARLRANPAATNIVGPPSN